MRRLMQLNRHQKAVQHFSICFPGKSYWENNESHRDSEAAHYHTELCVQSATSRRLRRGGTARTVSGEAVRNLRRSLTSKYFRNRNL